MIGEYKNNSENEVFKKDEKIIEPGGFRGF